MSSSESAANPHCESVGTSTIEGAPKVTLKPQLPVFCEPSRAVQLTGVVASPGKIEPEGGTHEGKPTPGQLSETVGSGKFTGPEGTPGGRVCETSAGQVSTGGCRSSTVMLKEQDELSAGSLQVTGVDPTGKNDPEDAAQVMFVQVPPGAP